MILFLKLPFKVGHCKKMIYDQKIMYVRFFFSAGVTRPFEFTFFFVSFIFKQKKSVRNFSSVIRQSANIHPIFFSGIHRFHYLHVLLYSYHNLFLIFIWQLKFSLILFICLANLTNTFMHMWSCYAFFFLLKSYSIDKYVSCVLFLIKYWNCII